MTADWYVEDADGRVEPITPRMIDSAACDECGDLGWVTIPCPRDPDCPGGDCCDVPCLSCNPNGRVR